MDNLNERVAKVLGLSTEHLESCWIEVATEDAEDGWSYFCCPKCGCAEESYDKRPCVKNYSGSLEQMAKLEHELSASERYKYAVELMHLVGVDEGQGQYWTDDEVFDMLNASPQHRCRAWLAVKETDELV